MTQVAIEDNVKTIKGKSLIQIEDDSQHENVVVIIPAKSINKKFNRIQNKS